MELTDIKINGVNMVNVTDSLEAPLLKLKISLNENTTSVTSNELKVYVDTSSTETTERKEYTFNLSKPLSYLENTTDEFIIEPKIVDSDVKICAYVKRRIGEDAILIEEVPLQIIELFEGTNYIYTNYENAVIDIMYPKNTDLFNYFLNNVLYGKNKNNEVLTLDDIYFKDCFTEVEAGINAAFNKVTTKCFDSPTNAFSMDCEGNLVVNSITSRVNNSSVNFDDIYPVGSIYMSVNNTNPTNLFGGTWEQITGYYLYAGNENTSGGSATTGAASGNTGSTTLTTAQIPSHTHSIPALSGTAASAGGHSHKLGMVSGCVSSGNSYARPKDVSEVTARGYTSTTAGAHTHKVTTTASTSGASGTSGGHTHTLGSHTHTINPPFYSVFVFKRTA